METIDAHIQDLREKIEATEAHLRALKVQLQVANERAGADRSVEADQNDTLRQANVSDKSPVIGEVYTRRRWPLDAEEYRRYGRQLIMPEIGLPGQLALKQAKVLIVGMGGLGCPAAAYLAGAGIGTLGLMDGDTVEASNLHRQIAHSAARVGMSKVDSAHEYLRSLNPLPTYTLHQALLQPSTALATFAAYDLILDCTDTPQTRYLISDTAVLARKPLISASALQTYGQQITLNDPARAPGDATGGPCYRCVFPSPPPPESVQSCGEGGILGPVVGIMGVLQALEAIKLITRTSTAATSEPPKPTLLMFSAFASPQFRSVRMRARRPTCIACSASATVTPEALTAGRLDYVAFCGGRASRGPLLANLRVDPGEFLLSRREGERQAPLVDVRDETQFGICSVEGSVNVPWRGDAGSWVEDVRKRGLLDDVGAGVDGGGGAGKEGREGDGGNEVVKDGQNVEEKENGSVKFLICRVGNDSQMAARALLNAVPGIKVRDVAGGFGAWRKSIDPDWPDY